MGNENKKQKDPLRIIVFIVSIVFIAIMWMKNDVISVYNTMPKEQALPLIATTILVFLN